MRHAAFFVFTASLTTSAIANPLQTRLDAVVRDQGWPGAAVLFDSGDHAPIAAAAGFAKLETRKIMSLEAGFHICSINKVVTAAAVLRLVDEGRLDLDAKVLTLLTSEVVRRIPNIERVSVRQLLDHSSGIYATNNDPAYVDTLVGARAFSRRIWRDEDLVALATLPANRPSAQPGDGHHYADTNYVLLGMIVERITGENYRTHVTRTIFAPLGMKDTYFYSDVLRGEKPAPASTADGYIKMSKELEEAVRMNAGFKSAGGGFLNTSIAAERIDAAGGLVMTLADLHKFANALFRGAMLKPTSRAWLLSVQDDMNGAEFGRTKLRALRGLNSTYGTVVYKEGDGPGGFNTVMAFHPESGSIFLGFTNQFGHFDEVDIMLRDLMGPMVQRKP